MHVQYLCPYTVEILRYRVRNDLKCDSNAKFERVVYLSAYRQPVARDGRPYGVAHRAKIFTFPLPRHAPAAPSLQRLRGALRGPAGPFKRVLEAPTLRARPLQDYVSRAPFPRFTPKPQFFWCPPNPQPSRQIPPHPGQSRFSKTKCQGSAGYRVAVRLDRGTVDVEEKKVSVQTDMSLRAEVFLEDRTVVGWIIEKLFRY